MTEKFLVSACLAGHPCRYDGASKPVPEIKKMVEAGEAYPFCPECAGGLKTPRLPCEIKAGRVFRKDGVDLTDAYREGAEKALLQARRLGIDKAILKSKSPSCGKGYIYDGSFSGALVEGDGLTAEILQKEGLTVLTEEEFLTYYKNR